MQNLNILYIAYHYPPANTIGGNRSFFQVSALRDIGHRVKVLHASHDDFRFIKNNYYSPHQDDISIETHNTHEIKSFINKSRIKAFLISYLNPLTKVLNGLKLFFFTKNQIGIQSLICRK